MRHSRTYYWLRSRFREPSTWRGIIRFGCGLAAIGMIWHNPEHALNLAGAIMFIAGSMLVNGAAQAVEKDPPKPPQP